MIRLFFKIFIWFVVIIFIFAILPDSFWNWLKPYFNIDTFLSFFKKGLMKFFNFIKESTGLDFSKIDDNIKNHLGLDIKLIFLKIRGFLANILERLVKFFKP